MITLLMKWWRARQRKFDLKVLWPQCKNVAQQKFGNGGEGLTMAKYAFAMHAFHDNAWTKDFSHDKIKAFIDNLA